MEVKIGVQFAPRELVVETTASPEDVEKALHDALRGDFGVFALVDDKGRRTLVPADKLAYVEIGENTERRVGFGAM